MKNFWKKKGKVISFSFSRYSSLIFLSQSLYQAKLESLPLRCQWESLRFLYMLVKDNFQINKNSHMFLNPRIATCSPIFFYRKRYVCRLHVFKYYIFPRTIPEWNSLLYEIVGSAFYSLTPRVICMSRIKMVNLICTEFYCLVSFSDLYPGTLLLL